MSMERLRALYALAPESRAMIYGPDEERDIAALVDVLALPQTHLLAPENDQSLAQTEVLISGWGAPLLDKAFLDAAPKLRAVFYGAGATGHILTPAVWERGIRITSAASANAVPVAEYTLATILFSLKHGWRLSRETRQQRSYSSRDNVPGCYGSTVGLISLGVIAQLVIRMLKPFDLQILVYDPFVTDSQAKHLGVEKVLLDDLFRRSDVVSLHTPHLPETTGLITGAHLASMKPGGTFINTARGAVVREQQMIEVLSQRPDLQAVLDVTENEPTAPGSLLYDLPNVVLTPHIAGSVGNECRRMGRFMVDELKRYLAGEPLQGEVTRQTSRHSSHRAGGSQAVAETDLAGHTDSTRSSKLEMNW
jgi:phosphoglycerate dehydrogenase-like enzyme